MTASTSISPYLAPDLKATVEYIGDTLAKSGMITDNKSQARILALTCIVRGCDPLTLLESYDIIQGKLSMKADRMLAGFREVGGSYKVIQYDPEGCLIEFTLDGQTLPIGITWADAQRENWPWGKQTGKKHADGTPERELKTNWSTPIGRQDMLWARVVSRGVRRLAPEVVSGRYTPEEIRDMDPDADAIDASFTVSPAAPDEVQPGRVSAESTDATGGVELVQQREAKEIADQLTRSGASDVDSGTGTAPQSDLDALDESIDSPCTPELRKQFLTALANLKPEVTDVADRLRAMLKRNGFEKLDQLTIGEVTTLLQHVERKSIEQWAELALTGHVQASELAAA